MPTDRAPASLQGEEAYLQLLGEIRVGALGPGARLTETDLARRLNISRTPVREAIRQLEADGLVVHQPRVGATIRTLDYSEVMELYEMRTVLEGTAARLAARSASEVEIAELAAINEEMRAPGLSGQRLFTLNQQFHLTMLDAARNRYLSRSVEALQKTLLILGPSTLEEASRATEVVGEHDGVLEAMRARDGATAEALMRRHMEASHKARLRQLRRRSEPVNQ